MAFEFADSVGDLQDNYYLVVDPKLAEKMDTYANKHGDPAASKMRYIPVKSVEQQSMLCVHRLREGSKKTVPLASTASAVSWPTHRCALRH